jgi:hypothetical protein
MASELRVNQIQNRSGLGTVTIGDTGLTVSGVITATGGVNIGIQSSGVSVASGAVSTLNFIGAGNTFAYDTTTKTIDISIQGGGGGGEFDITSSLFI